MAELLVHRTHKDYYDVIVVKEDGWQWGSKETQSPFVIIKLPDSTVEELEYLIEQGISNDNQTKIRRLNRLQLNKVSGDDLDKIKNGGTIKKVKLEKAVQIEAGFKKMKDRVEDDNQR